ncbi:hypothetical protein C8R44DRAFT_752402 [Mycena epipterygia]|nr:hypothetical protein C8R44DRAFT_752402 [Mycena epipterygia]
MDSCVQSQFGQFTHSASEADLNLGNTRESSRPAYSRYKEACTKVGLPLQRPPAPSSMLKHKIERDVSENEAEEEEAALATRFKREILAKGRETARIRQQQQGSGLNRIVSYDGPWFKPV